MGKIKEETPVATVQAPGTTVQGTETTATAPMKAADKAKSGANPHLEALKKKIVSDSAIMQTEILGYLQRNRTPELVKESRETLHTMAKGHVEAAHDCCKSSSVARNPEAGAVVQKVEAGSRLLCYSLKQAIFG